MKKKPSAHYWHKPVVVDWEGLKRMGWPFSREETTARSGGRYPKAYKLGEHHNARVLFRVKEVLDYFERHGLRVTEDWFALEDEERTTTLEAAE